MKKDSPLKFTKCLTIKARQKARNDLLGKIDIIIFTNEKGS